TDRDRFDYHVAYVAADPRLARGFPGTSGVVEFVFREVAYRETEVQAIQAPGRQRAEARLNGEVLHGAVVARREGRNGRSRIINYEVLTHQDRLRVRPGTELVLMDNAAGFAFRVEGLERRGGAAVATLQMIAGMTKTGQPLVGQNVEFGPKAYFSRRTQHASDRINNAGAHPTVAGPGIRGADYLKLIARLEG